MSSTSLRIRTVTGANNLLKRFFGVRTRTVSDAPNLPSAIVPIPISLFRPSMKYRVCRFSRENHPLSRSRHPNLDEHSADAVEYLQRDPAERESLRLRTTTPWWLRD